MGLRNSLHNWSVPPLLHPEQPDLTLKKAQEISDMLGNISPKPPKGWELREIFDSLRLAIENNTSILSLPNRSLRLAPWVLFRSFGDHPIQLGSLKSVTMDYGTWLLEQGSSRPIITLTHVLLRDYPVDLPTFSTWCHIALTSISRSTSPRVVKWQARCNDYNLLIADGPQRFAIYLNKTITPIASTFASAGLDGDLGVGKFAEHSFRALLSLISDEIKNGQAHSSLSRLIEFASPDLQAKQKLRFPTLAKELAESLLMPFIGSNKAQQYKEPILRLLLDTIGDPRIDTRVWPSVRSEARNLILSWLVEQNLHGFINILTETADPLWSYRRDFWMRYLEKNVISEAWVVLGSSARRLARNNFGEGFGTLTGASSDQSVLLMRIGGLTIAEWSHSGACRIWRTSTENAPVFYQSLYSGTGLRTESDYWVRHSSSERWKWQGEVARFIKDHTGISWN